MTINEEYQEILSKSKFISKGEWFDVETEVRLKSIYTDFETELDTFNDGCGFFSGYRTGYIDGCESCDLNEFLIYDEFGNEISELTLKEYKQLILE